MQIKNNLYEAIVSHQLKLQVDVSFQSHYRFMLQENLDKAKVVADFGTGKGYFLAQLAKNYPDIQFYGIDSNPERIAFAKQNHPLKNISWIHADVGQLSNFAFLQMADGIIMRYFLLHFQKIQSLLSNLFLSIKPKTCLWIIDLD
ncbi:MAG: class I SAM-dependent methyltransferase [candidate division KSB1 bacterium]|nr:class I SAM-dependent methyltransferase [candidate division KSB1 bacterium]